MTAVDAQQPGDVRTTEDLTAATATGLRWFTYTRLVLELLLLVSMVVLARLIPPAAFGVFAVVVIVQELALILPMEGIGSALVQRRSISDEHLQTGLLLGLASGLALTLVTLLAVVLVVVPVYGHGTAQLVLLATPCCLLGAFNAVPIAVLRRRLDFALLAKIEVASVVTRLVATIALAVAGLDATALVLGYLASVVVGVAGAWAFVRVPRPRWHAQAARELWSYGGPAMVACVAWTGFRNGDYAIINARLGAAQAGLYWRGYQLSVEYQRKISSAMMQLAFPVLSRTAGEDEMLALRRRMVQLLAVILFPLLIMLVVLAPVVVPWLFGPAWEPAVVPAQILALGGAATLVIDAVGPALMAAGRTKAMLGYGVGHFTVYAGSVYVVAPHGLPAVAVAASVVHTIFLVIAYQVLLSGRDQNPLRVLWNDIAPATIACLALAGVAGATEWALANLGAAALVHLTLVGAAGGVAYLVTLRACSPAAWKDVVSVLRLVLPDRLWIGRPVGAAA